MARTHRRKSSSRPNPSRSSAQQHGASREPPQDAAHGRRPQTIGEWNEMMRAHAQMRLAEIAFIPLDGEQQLSPSQIRLIEASRKACVDLLRAIDNGESRLLERVKAEVRQRTVDREDAVTPDRRSDDAVHHEPEEGVNAHASEPLRLRRGDADILASVMDDGELHELAALAALALPGHKRSGARENGRGAGGMIRAGP